MFFSLVQFFAEYNSKLLESTNYITRRQAVKVWLLWTLKSFRLQHWYWNGDIYERNIYILYIYIKYTYIYVSVSKQLIEFNATRYNTSFNLLKLLPFFVLSLAYLPYAWSSRPQLNMVFPLVMCIILDLFQSIL